MSILTDYCARLQQLEGGQSTNTNDPAAKYPRPAALGAVHTNRGITWETFEKMAPACGYEADPALFLQMPDDIWDSIFQTEFWKPNFCDRFNSPGLAALVADCAFNSGQYCEDTWLQEAIDAIQPDDVAVDHSVGELTLAAANSLDAVALIKNMTIYRLRDLQPIWDKPVTQQEWGGLQNRCRGIRDWALARA